MKKYDILVIGAGPAGYIAAIKSAQLGKKVLCIDDNEYLGGTCLNMGCIPSKSLLQSSHYYHKAQNELKEHGVYCKDVTFSLSTIMKKKITTLQSLGQGIAGLFKKNKVDYLNGTAILEDAYSIKAILKNGSHEIITTDNIILATGSVPICIPNINIDEINILTSTGSLSLNKVPEKMAIIGGGAIGLEIGSIWSRLGADVTVIEFSTNILNILDQDVSNTACKILQKQGLKFTLNSKVIQAEILNKKVIITIQKNNQHETMIVDKLLVAVGRKADTSKINLHKVGIKTDEKGRIPVNDIYQTAVKNIYAIGDVITGAMLAHKASEEGIALAEILAGQKGSVNYNAVPNVIYTYPEIASVGKSEKQLISENTQYKIGKFPFIANSRSKITGETDGFIKILSCKNTDTILGVHIIASNAGELIAEAILAIEFKASSEDLARICKPHPTVNEAMKEAALSSYFKAIHF